VPLLVHFFLSKHSHMNRKVSGIEPLALQQLEQHAWPGNVRELEHVVQQLLILADSETIGSEIVQDALLELHSEHQTDELTIAKDDTEEDKNLSDIEARAIASVLAEEKFNKTKAAKRLGIDRSTLRRKLQHNGVKRTSND